MKAISFASKSHVGMVRGENQDAHGKFPPNNLDISSPQGQLFVIADGMGGHAGGRQASRLAVDTIGRTYFSRTLPIAENLTKSFQDANAAIYDFSVNNPKFYGMGTTCIALVLQDGSAYVAHIGDSRLYRISHNGIDQLTHDHSKVAELMRRGFLTADEARNHPERSMLYRAMGVKEDMEFDLMNGIRPKPGDYFLMCTDGLTSHVEDTEIRDIVLSHPIEGSCDMLVDMANGRGGHDNITIQIIHIEDNGSFLKSLFHVK